MPIHPIHPTHSLPGRPGGGPDPGWRDYHEASKHRLERYAAGPGWLDWANQPDPWRRFAGAPQRMLPLAADALDTRHAALRRGELPPPAPFDAQHLGLLFELSLALSAWKESGGARWALRCNPSSGNLHPTEAYLIAPARPGLPAGVHHYVSRDHLLEGRAAWPDAAAEAAWNAAFGGEAALVALSAIHWREAWKYGMRAWRYCQHDCGHAIGALALAAAALGWHARVLDGVGDATLARLAGLDRDADFGDAEREAPEVLLRIGPAAAAVDVAALAALVAGACWYGRANRLSAERVDWPDIAHVEAATRRPDGLRSDAAAPVAVLPPPRSARLDLPVATLVRQRRSAVAFDGVSTMPAQDFFAALDALLPRPAVPPWASWGRPVRVHPVLFVHRVDGVEPGLYVQARDAAAVGELRAALREDWLWLRRGPAHLGLYLLLPYDLRAAAATISCHQAIAADSCFALGMLAHCADADAAPWRYRELYHECGLIGQVLYLEAEAAGLRGTGIGCFFDDSMHQLLGLRDRDWQSLYHFTVGGPLADERLASSPPYASRAPKP